MAGLFRGVLREIDGAMENTFEGYLAANRNFAQATRNIEAIQAGSDAAMRGRTEDTVPAFQRLTPQSQRAFRAGYGDPFIEQAQGAAMRVDARRPISISFTMFCQAASGIRTGDLVLQDLEQAIRERAYGLWIESGCPNGNAQEHWLAAQREVLSACLGTFARVSVSEPGVPKKSAKQRKAKSKKAQVAA